MRKNTNLSLSTKKLKLSWKRKTERRLKTEDEFYLYNFILDKEHLKNLRKDKEVHWFHEISGLILYVDKLTPDITKFLNYALEYKVNVTLLNKPDWGEPI